MNVQNHTYLAQNILAARITDTKWHQLQNILHSNHACSKIIGHVATQMHKEIINHLLNSSLIVCVYHLNVWSTFIFRPSAALCEINCTGYICRPSPTYMK